MDVDPKPWQLLQKTNQGVHPSIRNQHTGTVNLSAGNQKPIETKHLPASLKKPTTMNLQIINKYIFEGTEFQIWGGVGTLEDF